MYSHFINYIELNQDETYLEKSFLFDPRCRSLIHWANGKFGAMVDWNNDNVMRFVEYIYIPGNGDDSNTRQLERIEKDTYPVVALGIVAYWLKEQYGNLSTAQIFNSYYDKLEKDYIKQNEKALDGWKRNFKMEFYEKHLQEVQQQIIISENIYPFLKEKDVDDIKKLEANYLEFVKSKIQTNSNNNNNEIKQSEFAKHTKMEESVLNYISANNINYYYDGWRKGQVGAISQENGIYRFIELTRGSSGTPHRLHDQTEDNPIVAVGIVAYWLMFKRDKQLILKKLTKYTSIPETVKDMFDNYTQERYKQFKDFNRDNPNSWDWDWDNQFYAKYIIPHEIKLNKQSEALFDYISENDIKDIQSVMVNYINYLKKCRTERGYRVSPELMVLRAIDSKDESKYEDLDDYEIKAILEKLKNEGYIDAMWVHGQKLPWVCKMLDKGRAYLKQLEEGAGVIDVAPIDTQQTSSEQVSTGNSSQMTQPDDDSDYYQDANDEEWDDDDEEEGENEAEDEDESVPESREYDTTYDYIFDPRVKPEEVKKALDIITTFDKCQHPFWFVFTKVLVHLQWIPTSTYTKDVLKWASLQYDLNWTTKRQLSFSDIGGDKRDMNREANEGKQKKIKDIDITLWNSISKTEFRDIEKYRKFALLLKKTFVHFIVDGLEVKESTDFNLGKLRDRVKFMKSPKYLINSGK